MNSLFRQTDSKVTETTMNDSDVEKCVAEQVGKVQFPAPEDGGIVIVNYPFTFKIEKK